MKQFILTLFILFFNVAGLHSGDSAKLFVQRALNQVIQAQEALKRANAGVDNGLQSVRTSRVFLLQARIFLRSAKKAHGGGSKDQWSFRVCRLCSRLSLLQESSSSNQLK